MTSRAISHYEALLFDDKSTQRTDYKLLPTTEPTPTVYTPKIKKPRPPYPGLKNQYTFNDYDRLIPFSLLHKPKEVVRTNPRDCQEEFVIPKDEGRPAVQRTRPRLYITPAVALDDVESLAQRDLVIGDFYATSYTRAVRAAHTESANIAPSATRPADARPIRLPTYEPPVVPEEWRTDTLTWESRQLRSCVDPTCAFWLTRNTESKAKENIRRIDAKLGSVAPTHQTVAAGSSSTGRVEIKTKKN